MKEVAMVRGIRRQLKMFAGIYYENIDLMSILKKMLMELSFIVSNKCIQTFGIYYIV